MMHVELDWRELTNPLAMTAPSSSVPSVQRKPVISAPRGLTPPRLLAVDPDATEVMPRVVAAEVRLNGEAVNQRAEAEVAAARAAGAAHSLRVWRECHQRALLVLAREAAGAPATARCAALTWEQVGSDYYVSVSFTAAPLH